MYSYIFGRVTEVNFNSIVIDVGGIGYLIYVANPYSYEENLEYKVYLYQVVREDENSLYGFKSVEEKNLFLNLISVKGIGPKMALPLLATGSISGIYDAIERENILYLKKFPKIGEKVARQIILDLKGKCLVTPTPVATKNLDDLIEVLKGLGYKEKEYKNILTKINVEDPVEQQVKDALKLLLK